MPDIVIKSAFKLGIKVWFKTDTDQHLGVIIGVIKKYNGGIFYEIAVGFETYTCQSCELTETKDFFLGADLNPPKEDEDEKE